MNQAKPLSFFILLAATYYMLLALLAILPTTLSAADSLPIDTANIVVARRDFALQAGFARKLSTGFWPHTSLAAVLAENGVYIKQYGVTGLATISLRGADPQQTQVLWNGIPVSNPMAGMADLNTFGVSGTDDITILGSGGSSFFGSGNVGGSLLLSHNKPVAEGSSASANFAYSTYGMAQFGSDLGYKKGNFYVRNVLGFQQGNNAFPYRLSESSEIIKMQAASNAQFLNRFISGVNVKKWELKSIAEYTNNLRNFGVIPGTEKTTGIQWDRSLRVLGEAKYQEKKWQWMSRMAVFRDYLRFRDSNIHLDDTSQSTIIHAQTEWQFAIRNWRFMTGADAQYIRAITEAYHGEKIRTYPASFVAGYLSKNHWELSLNGRFEWYEKVGVGAARIRRVITQAVDVYGGVHSSFRRPALNDLFWDRNNNETLVSEHGQGAEAGIGWKVNHKKSSFSGQLSVYLRTLKNPIIWMPAGSGWEAVNLYSARYYGEQFYLNYKRSTRNVIIGARCNLDMVNAQMTSARDQRSFTRIFIPSMNGSALVYLQHRAWKISANYRYTGQRFITTDNTDKLPAYALVDAFAGYGAGRLSARMTLDAGFVCENIFGTYYQVIPGRAMPLRGYKITLKIYYKK